MSENMFHHLLGVTSVRDMDILRQCVEENKDVLWGEHRYEECGENVKVACWRS